MSDDRSHDGTPDSPDRARPRDPARSVADSGGPSRRRMLALCGAAVAAVAGCSDNASNPDDEDGGDGGDGGDSSGGGDGDGGSDGGDGNDGGDGKDGGDIGDGGDGGMTDSGDGTTKAPAGTDTPTGQTATAESGGGTTAANRPELGEATDLASSFAMDMTWHGEQQQLEMSGRFHEGDVYWEYSMQGQTVEWYLIDGTSYFVSQGQCFVGNTNQQFDQEQADPTTVEEWAANNPEVEPAGTDVIDGEEVLVYEADDGTDQVTFYVLADEGRLRRVEADQATWNFHSWGDVDPIEAPDMDCQDASNP